MVRFLKILVLMPCLDTQKRILVFKTDADELPYYRRAGNILHYEHQDTVNCFPNLTPFDEGVCIPKLPLNLRGEYHRYHFLFNKGRGLMHTTSRLRAEQKRSNTETKEPKRYRQGDTTPPKLSSFKTCSMVAQLLPPTTGLSDTVNEGGFSIVPSSELSF